MHEDTKKAKGFTLIELMVVVVIIGILASVAIPQFVKYLRKSKLVEAHEALDKIKTGAKSYYVAEHWDTNGNVLPHGFPTNVTMVPAAGPTCDKVVTPTSQWDAAGWGKLKFAFTEAHYFAFTFTSSGTTGTAAKYTSRAHGDLDCDTIQSTLEIRGSVSDEGDVSTVGPIITSGVE